MPPGRPAAADSHCRPSNPENEPSVDQRLALARSENATGCQVAPPSVEDSRWPMSVSSVSYQRSNDSRAPAAGTATGTVRVAVVASTVPENQSVGPDAG